LTTHYQMSDSWPTSYNKFDFLILEQVLQIDCNAICVMKAVVIDQLTEAKSSLASWTGSASLKRWCKCIFTIWMKKKWVPKDSDQKTNSDIIILVAVSCEWSQPERQLGAVP
jgi:hypothetical protein